MEKYLEAGKIVGTHALKGEVRVEVRCNTVEDFCALRTLYYDAGSEKIEVKSRPHKNIAVTKISGVDNVSDADALRGRILYVDREDLTLEEGEYFISDLIGLKVKDADSGKEYGEIIHVFNTGANDIYTMRDNNGKDVYIPVIDEIVISISPENGEILIRPMKGLFEE